MCQVLSLFFLAVVSEIEVQKFSVFLIWLPHYMTNDVIIIIKTFCMSSRSNCENFVSIRQAVAEKNTKALCGQTNKQTRRRRCRAEHNTKSRSLGNLNGVL